MIPARACDGTNSVPKTMASTSPVLAYTHKLYCSAYAVPPGELSSAADCTVLNQLCCKDTAATALVGTAKSAEVAS